MHSSYLSDPMLACFDNGEQAPLPESAPQPEDQPTLTQAQFNKALAEDRRKHQAKLEKTIEEVQARANLTAAEREALTNQLDDLRKEGRTKEAQLAHERKQLKEDYEKKLAEKAKAAETWELRYREGATERALLDAAVSGDAFNTETLMAVLRPMTQLSEITDASGKGTGRFEVKVDFPDTDPNTGEPIKALHTPQSAVKRMKELPNYVNLFKSGVVSGAGANAGGLTPGAMERSTGGRLRPIWTPTSRSSLGPCEARIAASQKGPAQVRFVPGWRTRGAIRRVRPFHSHFTADQWISPLGIRRRPPSLNTSCWDAGTPWSFN